MIPIFELKNKMYTKQKFNIEEYKNVNVLSLIRILAMDTNNIKALNEMQNYTYYLQNMLNLILLFFKIPRKQRVPFIKYIKKENKQEESLYEKIRQYFNWTDRELNLNMSILKNTIEKNKKEWYKKFGIKIGKGKK